MKLEDGIVINGVDWENNLISQKENRYFYIFVDESDLVKDIIKEENLPWPEIIEVYDSKLVKIAGKKKKVRETTQEQYDIIIKRITQHLKREACPEGAKDLSKDKMDLKTSVVYSLKCVYDVPEEPTDEEVDENPPEDPETTA